MSLQSPSASPSGPASPPISLASPEVPTHATVSPGRPPRPADGFDARVRTALVRRDRDRLADAVGDLIAQALATPPTAGTHAPATRDQILLARGVLLDIEHRLHADGPIDPQGTRAVEALVRDVRLGRLAPGDLLALDDAARAARRRLSGRAD